MRQRIQHGVEIDFLTADELVRLLPRRPKVTRVRAAQSVQLDANGANLQPLIVYKVPIGAMFGARRVQFELSSCTEANLGTGTISLGAAPPIFARYYRSDTPMGFAYPVSPVSSNAGRIPGVESWGDQQGPYLANGETFGVRVNLGVPAANATLTVMLEGLLTENPED